MAKTKTRAILTLAPACCAVLALAVSPAPAAATRAEYAAAAEPICKANADANARILKGVKGQVRRGELGPAGRRFLRASGALGRAIRQLAAVPRPAADLARLGRWLGYLRTQRSLLANIGKALRRGDRHRARAFAVRLNRAANRANNTVLGFGFRHCRTDARFV